MEESKKKILIIEDVPYLAESLEDLLTFKGYEALKATSGLDGLAMAIARQPDLILLDLKLPDIDGYELIRRLRRDPWGKNAHLLILTAAEVPEDAPADMGIDPDNILHKSHWGIDNIAARIEGELHST